LTEEWVSRGHL